MDFVVDLKNVMDLKPFNILRLRVEDLPVLLPFARAVFTQTFRDNTSEANMAVYVELTFTEEKLGAELQDPNSIFFGVFQKGRLIGFIKTNFGPAQTELQDINALELERIYIDPEFFGRRIGQLLMDAAIQVALENDLYYIWLGVWEHNHRAIAFYQKNGFRAFSKHFFTMGVDRQTDIMMFKALSNAVCSII